MRTFVKRNSAAPSGLFAREAAGLQWLSSTDGVRCVEVLGYDDTSLTLERLESVQPTFDAAQEFGRRLALTHAAGAQAFGAPPEGWDGPGFFGPLHQPLPMSLAPYDSWGEFYAEKRLVPMAELAGARLGAEARLAVDAGITRCRAGEFDDRDGPARLHSDLWNGNLM